MLKLSQLFVDAGYTSDDILPEFKINGATVEQSYFYGKEHGTKTILVSVMLGAALSRYGYELSGPAVNALIRVVGYADGLLMVSKLLDSDPDEVDIMLDYIKQIVETLELEEPPETDAYSDLVVTDRSRYDKILAPPVQYDDYVSTFLQPRFSGDLLMYNVNGRGMTLTQWIDYKQTPAYREGTRKAAKDVIGYLASEEFFNEMAPVPSEKAHHPNLFEIRTELTALDKAVGLHTPIPVIDLIPPKLPAVLENYTYSESRGLEVTEVPAEVAGFFDPDYLVTELRYMPRYQIYDYNHKIFTMAKFFDNHERNIGVPTPVELSNQLIEVLNNNFFGTSGLKAQVGRLRKVFERAELSRFLSHLASTPIFETIRSRFSDSLPDHLAYSQILKSDKEASLYDLYSVFLYERRKVMPFRRSAENPYPLDSPNLPFMALMMSPTKEGKLAREDRDLYDNYFAEQNTPFEEHHAFNVLQMNNDASGGIYFTGKHREEYGNEVVTATAFLDLFIAEFKSDDEGRYYLDHPNGAILASDLRFVAVGKLAPKPEVTSIEKLHSQDRNIVVPNSFAYIPAQIVTRMVFKNSRTILDYSPAEILELDDIPKVNVLYGFSAAGGEVYKLLAVVFRYFQIYPDDARVYFVYADNLYVAERVEEGIAWFSLDASKMESSHTPMSFLFEICALIEEQFGHTFEPAELNSLFEDYLLRFSSKDYPPLGFRSHSLRAFEAPQAPSTAEDFSDDDYVVFSHLLEDGLESLLEERYPMISRQWINYLIYMAMVMGNTIALLGTTQFLLPGLPSGAAFTFHMNTVKMGLTARTVEEVLVSSGVGLVKHHDLDTYSLVAEEIEKITGVLLKEESYTPADLSPFSELTEDLDIDKDPGIYPLDMLGYDMFLMRIFVNPKDDEEKDVDVFEEAFYVLAKDRLLKSMIFSKFLAYNLEGIIDEQVDRSKLEQLADLSRWQVFYLVGAWAHPGLAEVALTLATAALQDLGDLLPDSPVYFERVSELLRSVLIHTDEDSFPMIASLLDPEVLQANLTRSPVPTIYEVIRIMGRPGALARAGRTLGWDIDLIPVEEEAVEGPTKVTAERVAAFKSRKGARVLTDLKLSGKVIEPVVSKFTTTNQYYYPLQYRKGKAKVWVSPTPEQSERLGELLQLMIDNSEESPPIPTFVHVGKSWVNDAARSREGLIKPWKEQSIQIRAHWLASHLAVTLGIHKTAVYEWIKAPGGFTKVLNDNQFSVQDFYDTVVIIPVTGKVKRIREIFQSKGWTGMKDVPSEEFFLPLPRTAEAKREVAARKKIAAAKQSRDAEKKKKYESKKATKVFTKTEAKVSSKKGKKHKKVTRLTREQRVFGMEE